MGFFFRIHGLGSRDWSLGFRVQGAGFRIEASGFMVYIEGSTDIRLHGKGNSELSWRKAGHLHLVDVVDSDQEVINQEPSL